MDDLTSAEITAYLNSVKDDWQQPGKDIGTYELAELSRRTEWEILGVTCGWPEYRLGESSG